METVNYHHKIIVVNSKTSPIRMHTMLLREVLMAIGYSLDTAQKITTKTFLHFFKGREQLPEVLIERETFNEYLTEVHSKNKLETVKRMYSYFFAIIKLRLKQQGVIILIGGASGSGKSSLTSLIAGRLLLKEMSSDNIRHIMRNFISKTDSPFIFASTYESDHLIKDPDLTPEQRVIEGYLRQCKEVQRELKKVLEFYYRSGAWVIVEGVHITPEYILDCMKSFNTCFGCIVHVEDAEKYKNRFASRSSNNSIKPEDNKYIQSFDKILMIQSYLIKQAGEKLIPKIHNTNLDTSYCLIHRSFLKNLKLIGKSKPLVDPQSNKASMFHEEFLKTKEMLTKAKKIKEYIKIGRINKEDIAGLTPIAEYAKKEIDPDGQLVLARVNELEPITKENKHMIVILPKVPGTGQIKALKALIKSSIADDPIKVHWVGTDKRTLIFKTDLNHSQELFLYDFILDRDEIVERIFTDPVSKEKLFSKALPSPVLNQPTPISKSLKKPKKKNDGSDTSFESYKKAARKRKESQGPLIHFTDLKRTTSEQNRQNELDNSIDKLDSDSDSQHNETYDTRKERS